MPNAGPLKGSRPRVTVHFRDTANAGTDPASIVFSFMDSEFTETVYNYPPAGNIVRDAVGDYHVDIPVGLPDRMSEGKYFCRWEAFDAGGIALAAAEVVLDVYTRYPTRSSI
jgi:hypothetical protein